MSARRPTTDRLARLRCRLFGHRPLEPMGGVVARTGRFAQVMACPRCGWIDWGQSQVGSRRERRAAWRRHWKGAQR